VITITCQSVNLSDIHNILADQNVLLKENVVDVDIISRNIDGVGDNVWQLNAGITIAQNAFRNMFRHNKYAHSLSFFKSYL
jgi:hypothetical protein